jgi:hypothetical protein
MSRAIFRIGNLVYDAGRVCAPQGLRQRQFRTPSLPTLLLPTLLLNDVDGEDFLAFRIHLIDRLAVGKDKVAGFLAIFLVALAARDIAILVFFIERDLAFPFALILAVHPGAAHGFEVSGDDGGAGGFIGVGVIPCRGLASIEGHDLAFGKLFGGSRKCDGVCAPGEVWGQRDGGNCHNS